MPTKFIFVSGGVISGLGKGITTASIALLLKTYGFKVSPIKCDMYLNLDAGTMNPLEHGEIFVTHDGAETDQDIGHYERFLNENLGWDNYITSGQIYREVLDKERALRFKGKCVDAYLHIPETIIKRWEKQANRAEIVVIEFGGTVGEYQNIMFFEAARRMKIKHKNNVLFIHIGYLLIPPSLGEMKTKPLQQSIWALHSLGIQPDLIICRGEKTLDQPRKEKIAFAGSLDTKDIFANPDVSPIYKVPLILEKQGLTKRILQKLGLKARKRNFQKWQNLIKKIENLKQSIKIGIVGKYYTSGKFSLEDAYISVVEAIKHAAWAYRVKPKIVWFDSEKIEKLKPEKLEKTLQKINGLVVPQGWGKRGVEGKIKAIRFARENKTPYLGLCFGMQMAVVEFARNVLGFKKAHSTEVDPHTPHPVIHIMPEQRKYLKKRQYGGTTRLGVWPCKIKKRTRLYQIYSPFFSSPLIFERHRHRYEFNNHYRCLFEKAGMVISGSSPDGQLVEAIEIPSHPFFIGTQFHPEYQSRPLQPHPLFLGLIKSCLNIKI